MFQAITFPILISESWSPTPTLPRTDFPLLRAQGHSGRYLGTELLLPFLGLLHVLAQGTQLLLLNRISFLQKKESLFLFYQ